VKAYLSYSNRGYAGTPDSFLIDLHKIAYFYLKKNFGNAHLLTDSESKPFLSHLPWTSLTTELDAVPRTYPQVWSLSKLYAFREIAKRGEPFVHIDNDVILWEGLPKKLKDKEVFAQSWENVVGYKYEPEKFYENCPSRHVFAHSAPPHAANVGIFGGTNTDFIGAYAEAAIAFVEDPVNEWFWKRYSGYKSWWCKAVLAEQWFLSAFAESRGVKIETLFEKWPKPEEALAAKYTHLMAKKADPEVRRRIRESANCIVHSGGDVLNLGFPQ
jgi:hypothetical protein